MKLNDEVESTWKETVSILEPGTSLIKTDNDLILGLLLHCLINLYLISINSAIDVSIVMKYNLTVRKLHESFC